MARKTIPVRLRLADCEQEASKLHDELKSQDAEAVSLWDELGSQGVPPELATLDQVREVIAANYGVSDWARLLIACEMTTAIQENDTVTVLRLMADNPALLGESARGVPDNWGPPFCHAANVGHLGMMQAMWPLVAEDSSASDQRQHAFERAVLQGQLHVAEWLLSIGAEIQRGTVMGPCETLNADGLEFLLAHGAELCDGDGDRLAPVALVLQTYLRNPEGKHRCLEAIAHHVVLPDSPAMAFHRGDIARLEQYLAEDATFADRAYGFRDFYPIELGCHADETLALHGTPINGTLLHAAIDFAEQETFEWLLANKADVNATAQLDDEGFGGHTPLFNAVVSQSTLCGRDRDGQFAARLLEAGADPTVRASLRKTLRFVDDETEHRFRDVTPLEYADQFHEPRWVNRAAVKLIRERIAP